MKGPQLGLREDFTRVPNALLEAKARARLSGRQHQVLDALVRLLPGWGKLEDRVSAAQVAKIAGLPVRKVNEILVRLERLGIIERSGVRGARPTVRLRHPDRWSAAAFAPSRPGPTRGHPVEGPTPRRGQPLTGPGGGPPRGQEAGPTRGHTKDRKTPPKERERPAAAHAPLFADATSPADWRWLAQQLDGPEPLEEKAAFCLEHRAQVEAAADALLAERGVEDPSTKQRQQRFKERMHAFWKQRRRGPRGRLGVAGDAAAEDLSPGQLARLERERQALVAGGGRR